MMTKPFILLLLTACSAAAAPFLQPAVIAFAWDSAPNVTWRLYYGAGSRQYTNATAVSTNYLAVTLPARGVPLFFAITAVGPTGLESAFSSEVTYTAPAAPPSPTGFLAPVVLTVQYKNSLDDFMWADLTSFGLDPSQSFAAFRLDVAMGQQPSPTIKRIGPTLPPIPGSQP